MTKNNFNFDRCLKFVFSGGSIETETAGNVVVPATLVVEYNPRKANYLCPRLEATITDTPASSLKNRPGYEAELKIYNPNHDILAAIASGITQINKASSVYSYYAKKIQVAVYAGYYTQAPQELTDEQVLPKDKKKQNITVSHATDLQDYATYGEPLFKGYVNNSILVHKGTDSILTLACHDIDMTANQFNQIKLGMKSARDIPIFSKEMNEKRYKPNQNTFDASFRWLVTHLSTDYYPSELRGVAMSAMKAPIPPYYNRDTLNPGWFKVLYVTSLSAFESAAESLEGLEGDRSFWDENLRARATDATTQNKVRCNGFYTLKSKLPDALDDLCAFSGERLGYRVYERYGYTIYCVYKRGNRQNSVPLNTKGLVKVINFQNLLDTPTVAPNGSMKINMWFNKACEAWKYIALVLDSDYLGSQEQTGILNINELNFLKDSNNNYVVPLGGSTSNAAIATTQLSTSMPVAAAAQFQQVAAKEGYMFNTGFLMTKVIHKLSTHSKNWSTTVQTVPMMYGVKKE